MILSSLNIWIYGADGAFNVSKKDMCNGNKTIDIMTSMCKTIWPGLINITIDRYLSTGL
jgi:hypothetical protein